VDFLTTLSEITTVIADMLIVLPFLSRSIRRKLFRAIIADIIYDIVNNGNGQVKEFIDVMRSLVTFYDNFKGKGKVIIETKDD
jgi:hypothetical protein